MSPITRTNIASPAFKANPYPFYAQLREQAPAYRLRLPDRRIAWLITRYDDVQALLKDDRFGKNRYRAQSREQLTQQPWFPAAFRALEQNMLDLDAPDHTRLRALVHKAFTPPVVEGMRERIQLLSDQLLDAAQRRGEFDLIRDYALPIPTIIIAQLLGVPVEDRQKFRRWTDSLMQATASRWGTLLVIPQFLSFMRYVRRLIAQRRASPQSDLISALIQAEEAGDQLSEDELLAMVFLLLIAGHETTVNLIGNGMLALLRHPDQLALLRADPTLIKPAIEELLRYESPVESATERYAREDVTVAGTRIPRGELVFGVIAAANRDPRQFSDPDTLDIARQPNRHLAFGQGIHYCLGAPLARMEGQIAIHTLVRRSSLRLAAPAERLRWRRGLVLRGLESLPVAF